MDCKLLKCGHCLFDEEKEEYRCSRLNGKIVYLGTECEYKPKVNKY